MFYQFGGQEDLKWLVIMSIPVDDAFSAAYFQYSRVLFSMCAVNVVAMLHHYWEQKQVQQSKDSSGGSAGPAGDRAVHAESLILYESAPTTGPPYVCYVTLPGGSCFGNYRVCLLFSTFSIRYVTVIL